ncbi:GNAT family N-acetyltransferase [Kaistia geumhonensis]|uniref:GNAT superfamily N-acetyltransferase n=1 Tax=Kaistia geumhonensis TaxID=410839 RepID=A0ABU0M7N9_9HYPH|nr:GNAT family N-acetyltransferase [Kaistia geumhonensis]MCX5477794.1 GNAT family N-acetyltransferase [Kaistia geumhonensis]MDQ0516995.1 GNAT superfamily N-acetyltransferase [Kaistia geumhonensis]
MERPETDDTRLGALVEANLHAFLLALGRAGGGEERLGPDLSWTIGGSPIDYHNAAFGARLTAEEADGAIARSLSIMRRRGVPGSWHLGPSSRPPDLGARLEAAGFSAGFAEHGMAADLPALSPTEPPPGVSVEEVRDEAGIARWIDTLARGFGEGAREAEWVGACWRRLGYGPGSDWRHFIARLDGRPAATATLFLAAGVAGLYFVFTAEEARRRGLGAAVTNAALGEAARLGIATAVLGASEAGAALYRRLGFRDCCRLPIYEWQPDA